MCGETKKLKNLTCLGWSFLGMRGSLKIGHLDNDNENAFHSQWRHIWKSQNLRLKGMTTYWKYSLFNRKQRNLKWLLNRRMKISLSITDRAKYWGLFKSSEAIRILSLLCMFSKSKTLEKYNNCYIFRRINGTLKDVARLYHVSLFSSREKD